MFTFTTPPAPGSVLKFEPDRSISHVTAQSGRPGKWFPREHTFQFLGWATVALADPAGYRLAIEPMLLVNGQMVPASLIAAALGLPAHEQAVVTAIVPVGVAVE